MTSPRPSSAAGGMISIAVAATLWGTWSLFLRPAERIQPLAPATEAFVTFTMVALVVGPSAFRERARVQQTRALRSWMAVALLGSADAMNVLCYFWAMQRTSLAVAVLTHYLAPVLVALGAIAFLREPAQPRTFAALGGALLGLTLLLQPWSSDGGSSVGALLGAASAVFYAANVLVSKRLAAQFGTSELFAFRVPSALLTVYCFIPDGGFAISGAAALPLLGGALIPGALAGLLFFRGLARVDAGRASVLTLLEPLVAVLLGVLVWREPLPLLGWAGVALVLAGAYLVLTAKRSPSPNDVQNVLPAGS